MPHVIYLHSALTQHRVIGATEEEKRRIFHFELVDVIVAMAIAGVINVSMLLIAASTFYEQGLVDVGDDLGEVSAALGENLGAHADVLFGVALLASGLSSSSIGTMAGQVVMQGFIGRQIPLFVRRLVDDDAGAVRGSPSASTRLAHSCSARSCCRSASRSR